MDKINDRFLLGMVAGLTGNVFKMTVDDVSHRMGISQRSFRSTAAGLWVNKESEAANAKGQLLGSLFDFGIAGIGGVGIVELLTRTGNDHIISKGFTSGIAIGSMLTAMTSFSPTNKVKPKDAASNLSYMLSHAVYGVITAVVASKIGAPELYDVEPRNDYLRPTEKTSLQKSSSTYQIKHKYEKGIFEESH
jgi:hypothetical protein